MQSESRAPGDRIEVANTLSWRRGGLVVLAADVSAGRDRVTDGNGRAVPSQRLKDGRLAVLVSGVPPLGAIRLTLHDGSSSSLRAGVEPDAVRVVENSIENGVVRAAIDPATGDIRSLMSPLARGHEFVTPGAGLNRYLYVPGRDPAAAVTSSGARVIVEESGPLVATLRVESEAPGARSLVRRITVTAGSSAVEIEDVVDKTAVRSKESAHIAFPFNLSNPAILVDEGGAVVAPEHDQLPGSCRDFIGAHSAVDVSDGSRGVMLATLDAPLLEIGAITDERQDPKTRVRRWRTGTAPGSTVYAYLLNNYWHTNYKAEQEGRLVFRFVLQPHGAQSPAVGGSVAREMNKAEALRRFGADREQPLLAYQVTSAEPVASVPFGVEGAGVLVSSVRPGGKQGGLLVRLYNASGQATTARFVAREPGRPIRVERVMAETEGPRSAANARTATLAMRPFATVLVRVD